MSLAVSIHGLCAAATNAVSCRSAASERTSRIVSRPAPLRRRPENSSSSACVRPIRRQPPAERRPRRCLQLRLRRRAVPRRAGSRRSARSRPSPRPAVSRAWPGTVGHREGLAGAGALSDRQADRGPFFWPSSASQTSSFRGEGPRSALHHGGSSQAAADRSRAAAGIGHE